MDDKNEIFEGKTFDSLLKDIYDNSKRKETQIQILITELKPEPIICPNSAISFLLSSTVFFKSPKLLFNASKKPLETST